MNKKMVYSLTTTTTHAAPTRATSFLFSEYRYLGIFTGVFGVAIFLFLGSVKGFGTKSEPCTYNTGYICKPALANAFFITIAFLLGGSCFSPFCFLLWCFDGFPSCCQWPFGAVVILQFLGLKIDTFANARTTLEARKGVGKAFITTFRSGALMGFLLAANGLLVLWVSNSLFKLYYGDDWEGLFESITGASGLCRLAPPKSELCYLEPPKSMLHHLAPPKSELCYLEPSKSMLHHLALPKSESYRPALLKSGLHLSHAFERTKGFAFGSAALVSLALFGAFLLKWLKEVRRQFNTIPGILEWKSKTRYATCVKVSTDASLREMIPPGALVMLTSLIAGTFFGVENLAGLVHLFPAGGPKGSDAHNFTRQLS
uniref:H(+)-exporting diphosphatase n=1 Tax=Fagus sylvatica TaxID=28930 RepID=A0A2N9ENV1_FAGSY